MANDKMYRGTGKQLAASDNAVNDKMYRGTGKQLPATGNQPSPAKLAKNQQKLMKQIKKGPKVLTNKPVKINPDDKIIRNMPITASQLRAIKKHYGI